MPSYFKMTLVFGIYNISLVLFKSNFIVKKKKYCRQSAYLTLSATFLSKNLQL